MLSLLYSTKLKLICLIPCNISINSKISFGMVFFGISGTFEGTEKLYVLYIFIKSIKIDLYPSISDINFS